VAHHRHNPLPPLREQLTPNRSGRSAGPVRLVVVHDTEGGYQGSIAWLCNPAAQASAHVVLREDGREATQLVPWSAKAWACVDYNSASDNLELAGFARWYYTPAQLRRAARIVAYRLHKRGLPARWAKGGQGEGFCRHYDLGAAGGGHADPTTSTVKWLAFVALVKLEARRGHFRQSWGVE
jgi:hypothetical protein